MGRRSRAMTRAELLRGGRARLAAAGVDNPALDARLLLLEALHIDEMELIRAPEHGVGDVERRAHADMIARRIAGEPVARLLGAKEFFGLRFALSDATLVPRRETELLVEEALRLFPHRDAPLRLLDLGTGSGCLLLSILHARPNAFGFGLDRAPQAAATARENARALGLVRRAAFLAGDWAAAIGARFDLVVANPPYVRAGDIAFLAPEVARHDPRLALDGGEDGLDAYRALFSDLPRLMAPGGAALFEIGHDQAEAARALAEAAGFAPGPALADLVGHDRLLRLRA